MNSDEAVDLSTNHYTLHTTHSTLHTKHYPTGGRYFLLKKQKRNVCESDPYGRNVALQRVCSGHVTSVSKIIKSLGLSVAEFNTLSRRVSTDPALRDRVMRQVGD